MFGEKPIVGQTIIRIKSDRIILPEFTHVEAGDLVSATLDPYQKKVILLQEKELIERLNLRDEVFAVGVGTTLELYPSEQAYEEYQIMEEERKLKKQPK